MKYMDNVKSLIISQTILKNGVTYFFVGIRELSVGMYI